MYRFFKRRENLLYVANGVDLPLRISNTPEVGNVEVSAICSKYIPKSKVPNEYYHPNSFINRAINEMVHLKHIKEGKVSEERDVLEELGFGEVVWE